jgi:hypothetical protein
VRSFTRQRSDLLAVLEPLPDDGWSRVATVTGAGPALERTVLSYADRMARHERAHLNQIERAIATAHPSTATDRQRSRRPVS